MKKSLGAKTFLYPLPALLIGTYDVQGRPNIMTAAWGGICCSEPPCAAVSVQPRRWTHQALLQRKAFTLNIPSVALAAAADFAGIVSGQTTDKFAAAGLTPVRSSLVDAPYVAECPLVLELDLVHTIELGSHTQFIGRIMDVKAEESCLDQHGQPDIVSIQALIYSPSDKKYYAPGTVVGKAFSLGLQFTSPKN